MKNIKAILEQINNLVILLDINANVTYISPSVKKLLGYNPEELLGSKWWQETCLDVDMDALKSSVLDQLSSSVSKGGIQTERAVRTSYGASKWFLWNTTPTEDGAILSIGTDITDKKKIEMAVHRKNDELVEKNVEIEDSLNYAQRLQEVILPSAYQYQQAFSDAFLLYQPKDKVSGDFHWIYENENWIVTAAVDCTGHGVPGALLSVVGNSLLREIVIKNGIYSPNEILLRLDLELILAMSKENEQIARDGMDVALMTVNKKQGQVYFSGANRPLWRVTSEGELIEYAGSRFPIGFFGNLHKEFDVTTLEAKKGERYYLFSDGVVDQFGGPHNKKFKKSQLREVLEYSQDLSLPEQRELLAYSLKNWQQGQSQTDDVLVIGVEI